MVFSSSLFLVYFLPVFLTAYLLSPRFARNGTALIASALFYAWGAPLFIFVVAAGLISDFWIVRWMERSARKRQLVGLSVCLNIGLLAYFKYSNFLVDSLNSVLELAGTAPIPWMEVALPIGISFFTFQKLSYVIDVYRGKHASLNRFRDYALYIILFPQLIAGPIVRFSEIADQLTDRAAHDTVDDKLLGFFRFCIGLSKKVLIANVVGEVADTAFAMNSNELTLSWAWTGILAYTMQIYFDFSGYSDMAIGLGRMMGFVFPENFNNPYVSSSITEFWRRWHMTLSRWMKDYLYIPLGGNRVGSKRTYFNLWVVFLLSGLWHGASWNFVIWGAYHGFFLVAERLFLQRFYQTIGRFPSILITFFLAMMGWVLFRAESLTGALSYYRALFDLGTGFLDTGVSNEFQLIMGLALLFSFAATMPGIEKCQNRLMLNTGASLASAVMKTLTALLLFIFSLAMISASGFNPFIYFRF